MCAFVQYVHWTANASPISKEMWKWPFLCIICVCALCTMAFWFTENSLVCDWWCLHKLTLCTVTSHRPNYTINNNLIRYKSFLFPVRTQVSHSKQFRSNVMRVMRQNWLFILKCNATQMHRDRKKHNRCSFFEWQYHLGWLPWKSIEKVVK